MDGSVTILPWATKENRLVYNIKHVAINFKIPIKYAFYLYNGGISFEIPPESVSKTVSMNSLFKNNIIDNGNREIRF